MNKGTVRTDLALEAREFAEEAKEELRGIKVTENYDPDSDIKVTKVVIETKNGAKQLGKPMGNYITIEAGRMDTYDDAYHKEVAEVIKKELLDILGETKDFTSILVVGLGNYDVTADSLGPRVVDNLYITRHLYKEFGNAVFGEPKRFVVSSLIPGVMAKTGMEASEIVKGVAEETKPDIIIAIDALAARNTRRMNRTIQITDTGIHPGSGVGNYRKAITEDYLHIKTIAIGIPTVVCAGTIVRDSIEKARTKIEIPVPADEIFLRTDKELHDMFVTGKDVDELVKRMSFMVSEGINAALDV